MTEYRVVSDGHVYYLQYLKEYKVLFFTVKTWIDVPYPYYDKVFGSFLALRYNISLSTYNVGNLKEWADQHPNIEEYLAKEYEPEVARLRDRARKYRDEGSKDREVINS